MDTFIIQKKAVTFMILAIISCAPAKDKASDSDSLTLKTKNIHVDFLTQNVGADSLLRKEKIRSAKVSHHFSSMDNKDLFMIEIEGLNLIDGDVVFTIKDREDIEIYSDKFKAVELFNYGLKQGASIKEKNEFIEGRIDNFFSEENFKMPAILIDDSYDRNYNGEVDSLTWEKIKSNRNSIGFYYLKGEEDKSWIVFDIVNRVVVKYQVCC